MAFAAVEDLVIRWRVLSEEEQVRAAALLEDASVFIKEQLPSGYNVETREAALKMVCCNVAKRQMEPTVIGDTQALSQFTQTAGSYSLSGTIANPHGDMYLTNSEKKLLGIDSCQAMYIEPEIRWGE